MPLDNDLPGRGEKPISVLAAEAAGGVQGAFDRIAETYYTDIFKMIYYRTQSRWDAEDITQDVFIRAFEGIARLKSPERFRGWLFQIAWNRLKDHYRKKRVRRLLGFLPEKGDIPVPENETVREPEAETRLQEADFWNGFNGIARKLSSKEKEVFMLKFLDRLNIREIAQVMNRSESTVKTCLYRAIDKFRKEPALKTLLEEVRP